MEKTSVGNNSPQINRGRILAADLILLSVAFFWGSTFVVVQEAIRDIDIFFFLAIRFTLASFILFLWASLTRLGIGKKTVTAGFCLGTILFGAYTFQTFGLGLTTPSRAGFITGLSVVIVPVLSAFIFKQIPAKGTILGVAAAAGGLYLMTGVGRGVANQGDFLVLICAFLVASHILMTGHFTVRHHPLALTAVQIVTVAGWAWGGFFIFSPQGQTVTPRAWFGILTTALFATVFAFWAQTKMQRISTPTRAALIFTGEPVFAGLFDYLWNGRVLTLSGYFGGILILIGMVIAELRPRAWSG